jgi:hypothetical protein
MNMFFCTQMMPSLLELKLSPTHPSMDVYSQVWSGPRSWTESMSILFGLMLSSWRSTILELPLRSLRMANQLHHRDGRRQVTTLLGTEMDFTRKARWVMDGHKLPTPEGSTYAGVVSRESVRIALTYAAKNGLEVCAADIRNAYLQAPFSCND